MSLCKQCLRRFDEQGEQATVAHDGESVCSVKCKHEYLHRALLANPNLRIYARTPPSS